MTCLYWSDDIIVMLCYIILYVWRRDIFNNVDCWDHEYDNMTYDGCGEDSPVFVCCERERREKRQKYVEEGEGCWMLRVP